METKDDPKTQTLEDDRPGGGGNDGTKAGYGVSGAKPTEVEAGRDEEEIAIQNP